MPPTVRDIDLGRYSIYSRRPRSAAITFVIYAVLKAYTASRPSFSRTSRAWSRALNQNVPRLGVERTFHVRRSDELHAPFRHGERSWQGMRRAAVCCNAMLWSFAGDEHVEEKSIWQCEVRGGESGVSQPSRRLSSSLASSSRLRTCPRRRFFSAWASETDGQCAEGCPGLRTARCHADNQESASVQHLL